MYMGMSVALCNEHGLSVNGERLTTFIATLSRYGSAFVVLLPIEIIHPPIRSVREAAKTRKINMDDN